MNVLWFTHALTAMAGGSVVYLVMTLRQERTVTREQKARVKLGVFALAASVFLVAIGVQAYLAERDNAQRDKAYAAQSACLNGFASDFVNALNARVDANARLDTAKAYRDNALDRVVLSVIRARKHPTVANVMALDLSLDWFAKTKRNLRKVSRETNETLAQNSYPQPESPTQACPKEGG